MPGDERAELLAALDAVDFVIFFDEPTPEALSGGSGPRVHVQGGDYTEGSSPEVPPRALLRRRTFAIMPLVAGRSTTDIVADSPGEIPNAPNA